MPSRLRGEGSAGIGYHRGRVDLLRGERVLVVWWGLRRGSERGEPEQRGIAEMDVDVAGRRGERRTCGDLSVHTYIHTYASCKNEHYGGGTRDEGGVLWSSRGL